MDIPEPLASPVVRPGAPGVLGVSCLTKYIRHKCLDTVNTYTRDVCKGWAILELRATLNTKCHSYNTQGQGRENNSTWERKIVTKMRNIPKKKYMLCNRGTNKKSAMVHNATAPSAMTCILKKR